MAFTQFSSATPVFNPFALASASLFGPIQASMQMGWIMHYQMLNALSWGLLDDIAEEFEHALVEGRDAGDTLMQQIQALQGAELSPDQRQQLAQAKLHEAEESLHSIANELVLNLLQLPFTRLGGKPARKRFAVTLEGQAQRLD